MPIQDNLIEQTLEYISSNGYISDNNKFLKNTSKFLSELFNVNHIVINKYSINKPNIADTIVFYEKGKFKSNISYNLKDTPCSNVIDKVICHYPNNVQKLFPKDRFLVHRNINSYIGVPLWNSKKEPIGLIALMNVKPFEKAKTLEIIIKIIAIQIEKVLENILFEEISKENELEFKELSNLTFEGIAIHELGKAKHVNLAMEKMFGYTKKELIGKNLFELFFQEKHHNLISEKIIEGYGLPYELEGVKKDGSIFPVEIEGRTININTGIKRVTSIRDLTDRKKVEKQILRTKTLLFETQKIAGIGSFILNISTGLWESSSILNEIFGIEKNYVKDEKGWSQILHPNEQNSMLEYMECNILKNHEFFDRQYRVIKKNSKEIRWVHGLGKLEFDESGNPIKFIGTIQDITASKKNQQELQKEKEKAEKSEKELKESEHRFKSLIDQAGDGMCLNDFEGNIIEVNNKAVESTGYSRKELLSMKVVDIDVNKPLLKDQQKVWDTLKEKTTIRIESQLKRKDGSIFPAEISIGIVTIKEQKLILCFVRDISERIDTQVENKKLSAAVEQSANSIIITCTSGNIEYTNPKFSEITGYSAEEVIGKNPNILSSGNQSKKYYKEMWKIISNGNIWKGEFLNKAKNGNLFWEQATITPIKNINGEVTNYLAIKEDITDRKKSEEALKIAYNTIKEKENYLVNILETANEGFWIIGKDGITIDVNKKMCSILDRTSIEIKGKSIFDFVDEENRKIFKNQLIYRDSGIATSYEIELLKPDGFSITCLFNTSPIYNKNKERVGSFALVTDISNVNLAYKKLEIKNKELIKLSNKLSEKSRLHLESKNKFQNLFEHSPVSLWEEDFSEVKQFIKSIGVEASKLDRYFDENHNFLLECIRKIKIIRVNKSTLDLIGVKNIEELTSHLKETNNKRSFNVLKKELVAIASNCKEFNSETEFTKTNGERISAIVKSEIDVNGIAIVSVIDITAIKRAEYQIQKAKDKAEKSDERYRLAVRATGLGIWDWDITSNSVYYSKYYKHQIGYQNSELENKFSTWEDHIHPDDIEGELLKIEAYQKNPKGQYVSEFRFKHKNGSYIWILSRAEVLTDKNGKVVRMFGSHRDISVRKKALSKLKDQTIELVKAKEKAEESNKLKTEFLHNMSHEIRTPMNGILGFSNFLRTHNLSNEKRDYYINIIQNSGNQLLRIIDDILEISRLETKQVKVIEKPVCLNDLLLELFSIFDIKAKENGIPIYLKNELSDSESVINTDKSKLNKVLSNLLENSLKFTHTGSVKLGYKLIDENIELYVEDTGIGINEDKQEIIFERFSQEDENVSQSTGGLGLGLSIAKENTELLGGNISLTSKKGVGSKFVVSIPYKPINKVTNQHKLNGKLVDKQNKYTVLIVEDEEVNFMFIEILLLEKNNYNIAILHAENGKEAVELCRSNDTIDLVLMDINMPLLNGYEATKQIKSFKPNLPIIAQTAYSTIEDKDKAKKAGCDSFISKPIKEKSLKTILDSYLIENKYKKKTS